MHKDYSITSESILAAHKRIESFVHQTPVLSSTHINSLVEAKLFFKCENFQKIGAFKIRGALNAVMQLSEDERSKGLVTHSSGNHAQAVALAAKINKIKSSIVMPQTAPQVKIDAVRDYGAEIIFCEPNQASREASVKEEQQKTGAVFIHPYNNYHIMEGQATAALELIKKHDDLDYLVAPVGGGGLLSGTALSANYFSPSTKVIGAEPEGADDAQRSLRKGKLLEQNSPNTIADGLLTGLGDKTFAVIREHVDQILTANDEEIIAAMKLIYERMKIIIEPSSAVTLAVILKNKGLFKNKKVGIILSGGNVDLKKLPF